MKKILLGSLIAAGNKGIAPEQYQLHSALYLLQEKLEDADLIEDERGYIYKPYVKGAFSDNLQRDLDILSILGGVDVIEGSWKYNPDVDFLDDLYAECIFDAGRRSEEQALIGSAFIPLIKLARDALFDMAYSALNEYLAKKMNSCTN